jgi:hypothetical protein
VMVASAHGGRGGSRAGHDMPREAMLAIRQTRIRAGPMAGEPNVSHFTGAWHLCDPEDERMLLTLILAALFLPGSAASDATRPLMRGEAVRQTQCHVRER